jgi:predicted Fe-S protein YdhL (DUF1289 family)
VRSPCVSVCRIDVDSGYCEGCLRTIGEISDWGMMSDERKREVWRELRLRRTRLAPVTPTAAPMAEPAAPDTRAHPAVAPVPIGDSH